MVRYTKKEGKIIKNNSYKYGYLGVSPTLEKSPLKPLEAIKLLK